MSKQITATIPNPLHQKIKADAEKNGVSFSGQVAFILSYHYRGKGITIYDEPEGMYKIYSEDKR